MDAQRQLEKLTSIVLTKVTSDMDDFSYDLVNSVSVLVLCRQKCALLFKEIKARGYALTKKFGFHIVLDFSLFPHYIIQTVT